MKPRVINRRRVPRVIYLLLLAGLIGGYIYWALNKPLPELKPNSQIIVVDASNKNQLVWPASTQSAVGVVGNDEVLQTSKTQRKLPTASTAKIITCLVILDKKPLAPGQSGATITLTDSDVALYKNYAGQDGSVLPIQAGEKLTELQMLQAIMLPSANNIADSLAIWAYGSLANYSKAANQYLTERHLSSTRVGSDASGLSPDTVSNASDLVKLGKLTMQNPVLAKIVGQPTADGFPIVGTIKNVNFLLGTNGIVGIKTGNSDQAGGVFVSASQTKPNTKSVTLVTTVIGSSTLFQAMKESATLISSAQSNFQSVTVAKAGQTVAHYQQPWGGTIAVTTAKPLSLKTWSGLDVVAKSNLKTLSANSSAGTIAGKLVVPESAFYKPTSVDLKLANQPTKPSVIWRLTHPF